MEEQTRTSRPAVPRWTRPLAVLALAAGLLVGLLALFAALGVWFGWWDFRRGFALLRIANSAALWVALGCGAIAFALFFTVRKRDRQGAMSLASMAFAGGVAAILAWQVPQSYRPPEGTPPIHDISTDTENPPPFVDVLPLRADAPNSHVYGDSPDLTPQKLAELQREAYPDVQPRYFDQSREEVFARALEAVDELGWDLVAQSPEEGRIEATDTTFWFRFKDDIVIRIREEGDRTRVDARSVSRVGTSDVGKNAQRIREFFAAL
ncbi:DUF1499 domain-containing protein [Gilvimarinus sp. F26214L]|uniref:DUF1499 domain-containing protein n=1 Tax=Gilvimarinus sp. DZF01 TaxID=3461371 RepID=UPI00404672C2